MTEFRAARDVRAKAQSGEQEAVPDVDATREIIAPPLPPATWRHVVVDGETREWGIATETPVEIRINGEPWTVVMASPADLDDLAIGLAVTEGVLRDPAAVEGLDLVTFLHDIRVDLKAPASAIDDSARRARSIASGTACGLCGIESLAQLTARRPAPREARAPVSDEAILAAFAALPDRQPVNRATRSAHAAAWCTPDGLIMDLYEDVGRHNALDKLVGSLARIGALGAPGFIIMTSRCSYELVAKASVTNASILATISAPTNMALTWARELSLPLASTIRVDGALRLVHFPWEDAHAE